MVEIGQHSNALIHALLELDRVNQYILFFDYRTRREAAQVFEQPNVTIKFLPFSGYGKFLPVAYSQLLVAAAFAKERLDVLHSPSGVVPVGFRWPFVVTIRDLAAYKHPEWFPRQIISNRLLISQTLKRAQKIIAVSQSTKNDIRELFNEPAKKIVIVPEAADTSLLALNDRRHNVRKIYKLPTQYLLSVGAIEARKDLATLFRAWQIISSSRPEEAQLILAGSVGHRGPEILQQIKKLKLSKVIRYIGYVPHNHKILLMKQATAVVYPTQYEGFGLPVLEAMQLGTPVITTRVAAIPEVAEKATLMVAPQDASGLAKAMLSVLSKPDLRASYRAKGLVQAAKFSWCRTAEETLRIYKQAAK